MAEHLCLSCKYEKRPPGVDGLGWPKCGMPEPDDSVKLPHYARRRHFKRLTGDDTDILVDCSGYEVDSR